MIDERALIARAAPPQKAPDEVRERAIRADRAIVRETPEIALERVEPVEVRRAVGDRAHVRVREERLLLVEDEVRRRRMPREEHASRESRRGRARENVIVAEEVIADRLAHRHDERRPRLGVGRRRCAGRRRWTGAAPLRERPATCRRRLGRPPAADRRPPAADRRPRTPRSSPQRGAPPRSPPRPSRWIPTSRAPRRSPAFGGSSPGIIHVSPQRCAPPSMYQRLAGDERRRVATRGRR